MKRNTKTALTFFIMVILVGTFLATSEADVLGFRKWFKFSQEGALKEWREHIFKGKVYYTIEHTDKEGYVRAKSESAASGYYHRIRFSAKERPMISWKWKVTKFPEKEGLLDRPSAQADDYAARLYVIFVAGSIRTSKCIEYVWDEHLPEGRKFISPVSENIRLIVVQSGPCPEGEWVYEERNLYEDYKSLYGAYPRLKIGAVAFMTDTDDTRGTAEAFYDEIKVGYTKVEVE